MAREENVRAQENLAANINAGDVDAAVESFAEDAVDHDPAPDQGPGRDGFRAFWQTMLAAFPDAHIEPRHEVADEDHVVVAYTFTGTHQGDFEGIAPTWQADRDQRHPDRPLRERPDRRAVGVE